MSKCLLVSTNSDRTELANRMRQLGLLMYEASNCTAAFNLMAKEPWAAVIVEARLPDGQAGWEFIEMLCRHNLYCSRYILLSDVRIEDAAQASLQQHFGVTGFMERPLDDVRKLRSVLCTYKVISPNRVKF